MKKKPPTPGPLKPVFIIGLILAVIISWSLAIFVMVWARNAPEGSRPRETAFARSLREYDLFDAPRRVLAGENPNQIERRLSALQRRAGSVDEQLSVLKRRRELALTDRRYIDSYAKAAQEAAGAFPYSSPLAAVAAEATLLGGTPLSANSLDLLKTYASRITQNRFDLLALSVNILAGNLRDPAQAAGIPAIESLLSLDHAGIPEQAREALLVNEFLMLAYKRDIAEATWKLNNLLLNAHGSSIPDLRMGADFLYDHSLPLRAAELFLMLGSDADNARAADALVLAGEIQGARNIWRALSSPSPAEDGQARQIRFRSLYNMASSSADRAEEILWLERLFTQQGRDERMETYSVIRYTRVLDTERSIAILDDENMRRNPLLDLELLRRRLETFPLRRATAEVWLLVGRQSGNEAIYEWAAWYFEHQQLYSELPHLLLVAGRREMTGAWLNLHRGLASIREGKLSEGERTFREALQTSPGDWRILANLGRIQENRRVISSALVYYEAAAASVSGRPETAQLQLRISRCLEALGRINESRRALELALELDPYNINIQRQLRRFLSDHF
jgi:tetratricopeptide (TPR) repeat protein